METLAWRHSETVLVILVPLTMWKEHQARPKYPQNGGQPWG